MYPVQNEPVTYNCTSHVVGEHKSDWTVTGQNADAYDESAGGWVKMFTYTCKYCSRTDSDWMGNMGTTDNPIRGRCTPRWGEKHEGYTAYSYVDKNGVTHAASTPQVTVNDYYYLDYVGVRHSTTQGSGSINGGAYYDAPSLNSVQSAKLTAKSLDGGNLPANTAGKYIYVGTPD